MLIKKSDSKKFENSEQCTVWEYPFASSLFSFATALINGRYPEERRVCNKECEEIYYVVSGTGVVHSEKGDFELNPGDVYFFVKAEKYFVIGKDLKLALVNAPKWSEEQHEVVD